MKSQLFPITCMTLAGMFFLTPVTTPVSFAEEVPCKDGICVNSFPKTHSRGKKFKVCTKEVDRCFQTLTTQGPCGKVYEYTVSVITYQDVYSDGTTRIWKVTI